MAVSRGSFLLRSSTTWCNQLIVSLALLLSLYFTCVIAYKKEFAFMNEKLQYTGLPSCVKGVMAAQEDARKQNVIVFSCLS